MSSSEHGGDSTGEELPAAQRIGWLAVILIGAFALRIFRIDWSLPDYIFNDTRIHFVDAVMNAIGGGDWTLYRFTHPPLFPYFLSASSWIWASLTGNEISMVGREALADRAAIALLGRILTVVLGTLLAAATYLLGRRLLGTRSGLWAAAFVALSPLHVIECHRVNVDTPMLLLGVLSAHQAVVAAQERNRRNLRISFALAALAGAVKYTGLYAGTLPIWVALRWPESSWRQRWQLIVEGGVISLATFALAMSPVLLNLDAFGRDVYGLFYINVFHGAPGQNLTGESWVYAPYLYMTFVGLPFMVGWSVFAAAVAGLAVMAKCNRRALVLIAAAALPFYVLQGNAETAVARYYFPLMTFLALAAGAFVAWIREVSPKFGTALALVILGYSVALAVSQVGRIGGEVQAEIGNKLERLALAKQKTGISLRAVDEPRLVIAYPSWATSIYDALSPYMRKPRRMVLGFFPTTLRDPGDALPERESVLDDRRWINRRGVDAIIVTSRWENLRRRKAFRPREEQFYQNLNQGRLGLRQVAHVETTYLTQSWYEWADPTLDTLWTAGISGYKLYVRDDLVPALTMQIE